MILLTPQERALVAESSAALVAKHPVDAETIQRNKEAYQRRIAADAEAKRQTEHREAISRQKAEAIGYGPCVARKKAAAASRKSRQKKATAKLPAVKSERVLEKQARRLEAKRIKEEQRALKQRALNAAARARAERAKTQREENEAAWARMEAHRDAKRKPAVDCAPASSAAVRTKPSLCARCAGMSHRVRGPECIDCGTKKQEALS